MFGIVSICCKHLWEWACFFSCSVNKQQTASMIWIVLFYSQNSTGVWFSIPSPEWADDCKISQTYCNQLYIIWCAHKPTSIYMMSGDDCALNVCIEMPFRRSQCCLELQIVKYQSKPMTNNLCKKGKITFVESGIVVSFFQP